MHYKGVTSNLLVMQSRARPPALRVARLLQRDASHNTCVHTAVLLPVPVFEHELVRLHVRRAPETAPELQRPFKSEHEKMGALCVCGVRAFAWRAVLPC